MNHDQQAAINPACDEPAPRSLAISASQTPGTQPDPNRDWTAEWMHSAMQTSREMHQNEDFRREVAKRLF